jgi:quercetin dioxygenase-like cupin family protein
VAITRLASHDEEPRSVFGEAHVLMLRNTTYSLFQRKTAAGEGLPPHVHDDQDEAVYVLDGEYLLSSGEGRRTLAPGSCALVPRGTVHSLVVPGNEPARCLVIFNPPGAMDRFYEEARTAGAEEVLAIARRLGIQLLTSPV